MIYSMMAALVTSSQDLADDSFHPPLPHSPHVNDLKNRNTVYCTLKVVSNQDSDKCLTLSG